MRKSGGLRAIVCALATAAIGAAAHSAGAFELKRNSQGQTLHWSSARVSYVIDPSVEEHVSGGAAAAASAVGGWSRAGNGPVLSTSVGPGGAKPGLDGQNSVIFAPDGFAPAGQALAVTVTSYDDSSGEIVDSDIVINGSYAFAVLNPSAHAATGAKPISTDGSSNDDDSLRAVPFDLVHVASHEVGHTLGLADEKDDSSSLMYGYTMPEDATVRTPTSDDVQGLDALYMAGAGASEARAGCGQSSVAGSRTHPADAWTAMALMAVVGLRLASRRRSARALRIAVPAGAAFVALVGWQGAARSATPAPAMKADAIARVANVSTSNNEGIFETTLELVPSVCQQDPCPGRVTAHVWGGTMGGITQRVGVGRVPSVGDTVDVAFVGHTELSGAAALLEAAVVSVR
ncbi:MAG: matrixin family metalloprotease [Polyangiaceae bacterium]